MYHSLGLYIVEVCSALVAAEVAEPTAAQRGNAAEHGTKFIAVSGQFDPSDKLK